MSTETSIITRECDGKTIVEIDSQNVDFRNCETIKSAVANIIHTGKTNIILQLGRVGFMDSSGLSVLLYCKRTCEEAGGGFVLCGVQGYVSNLINLTNLHKSIPIYKTETEATEA